MDGISYPIVFPQNSWPSGMSEWMKYLYFTTLNYMKIYSFVAYLFSVKKLLSDFANS